VPQPAPPPFRYNTCPPRHALKPKGCFYGQKLSLHPPVSSLNPARVSVLYPAACPSVPPLSRPAVPGFRHFAPLRPPLCFYICLWLTEWFPFFMYDEDSCPLILLPFVTFLGHHHPPTKPLQPFLDNKSMLRYLSPCFCIPYRLVPCSLFFSQH